MSWYSQPERPPPPIPGRHPHTCGIAIRLRAFCRRRCGSRGAVPAALPWQLNSRGRRCGGGGRGGATRLLDASVRFSVRRQLPVCIPLGPLLDCEAPSLRRPLHCAAPPPLHMPQALERGAWPQLAVPLITLLLLALTDFIIAVVVAAAAAAAVLCKLSRLVIIPISKQARHICRRSCCRSRSRRPRCCCVYCCCLILLPIRRTQPVILLGIICSPRCKLRCQAASQSCRLRRLLRSAACLQLLRLLVSSACLQLRLT